MIYIGSPPDEVNSSRFNERGGGSQKRERERERDYGKDPVLIRRKKFTTGGPPLKVTRKERPIEGGQGCELLIVWSLWNGLSFRFLLIFSTDTLFL